MAITDGRTKAVKAYGDFQTPLALAQAATQLLRRLGIRPRSILEPSCGRGAFVAAAAASFPEANTIIGVDINRHHLSVAETALAPYGRRVVLRPGDFFKLDWQNLIAGADGPWLILGNPPWVTSSALGAIGSDNIPEKSNFHRRKGIEAITGKSNFDISEWMLLRYLDWLEGGCGTIAVLCKTSVARKILLHVWQKDVPVHRAQLHKIDALGHFGAAAEACLFVLELRPDGHAKDCGVFDTLDAESPLHAVGFLDGQLVADAAVVEKYRGLLGSDLHYVWRSGVKHDCAKVMELRRIPGGYENGLSEAVVLEDRVLFPMLKSSDIGNRRLDCRGAMLVPQKTVGEDIGFLQAAAPRTWDYLSRHAAHLDRRRSIIYRNKPRFSVFGVGPYSFAPWKVAVSGFYKKLRFVKIGPVNGRPVVFDDTVYFLACRSEQEADFIEALLCSDAAQAILHAMIHWDEKRPVTASILKRLSIQKLAASLGREDDYSRFANPDNAVDRPPLRLLRASAR